MKAVQQVLIALTQALNVALGGWADESTSSRAHRQQHKRRWQFARAVINGVFFWQEDHCAASYEAEMLRRHFPPALRNDQTG